MSDYQQVETPRIFQQGLSSVVLNGRGTNNIMIELCDLPRIIKQLQDIREATNIAHRPNITGICSVCGNECLDWENAE